MRSEIFVFLYEASGNLIYGTIAVVALLEILSPRRILNYSIIVRWSSNLAIGLINTLLGRWLFALLGISAAVTVGQNEWGLLNTVLWPSYIEIVLTILALDCIFYWIHRLFHAIPTLWRVHLVHHSDLDIDFSTGARHHPIEVLIAGIFFVPVVAILGMPPLGVLWFLTLRAVAAYFEHANLELPGALDRFLRFLIVTPDMHRIHHSATKCETDSNFGDLFSFWDRLFRTYREQPANGHEGMRIGLDYLNNPQQLWLHRMLTQPFINTL